MSEKHKDLILLVDDDKFLLEMYGLKFRESGKDVEICLGATEALERLRGGLKASVIVLDIVMPTMDGFALLEAIKEEKLGGDSVVIMLTNQGEASDIEQANKLGADGYIVKASAIPSEVLEKVDAIVKRKHKETEELKRSSEKK